MRLAAHHWLAVAGLLMASPLAAQPVAYGHLPGEDQTSRSVPPAPPPERRSPPPFPKFSPAPPKARHIRVASKPKPAVVHRGKKKIARKAATPQVTRLTTREAKDQRWCASLSKQKLSRNAKCRKILDRQKSAKRAARVPTKLDRKDERRCGKLSLNQVLRDQRCRKFAERQLAAKPVRESKKASPSRTKVKPVKKSSTKSHSVKKRSRR